jgi:hypothetical protein
VNGILTVQQRQAAYSMSEDALQETIRKQCRALGFLVQHEHDSRRSWLPGWPDLVIVGKSGILWRELKSEAGRLSPEQRQVGSALHAAGQDWAVWRPRDWVDGTIQRQLEGIA